MAKPRRGVVGGSRGRPRAGPEQTLIDDEDDAGINGGGTNQFAKTEIYLGKVLERQQFYHYLMTFSPDH